MKCHVINDMNNVRSHDSVTMFFFFTGIIILSLDKFALIFNQVAQKNTLDIYRILISDYTELFALFHCMAS